jgi:hypothetical protein
MELRASTAGTWMLQGAAASLNQMTKVLPIGPMTGLQQEAATQMEVLADCR